MTTAHLLIFFTLALMSPGIDFTVVTKNSLTRGQKAGLYTALGVALGVVFHFTYLYFLLETIVLHFQPALRLIQIVGGGYVFYLGYQVAKQALVPTRSPKAMQGTPLFFDHPIAQGFWTNILNPKVSVLFISVFSTYIQTHSRNDMVLLFLFLTVMSWAWFSFVAYFWNRTWMKQFYQNHQRWINGAMAIFLFVMAIEIWIFSI